MGEYLVEVTEEAEGLPDVSETLPDGTDAEVTRVGESKSLDTWPEP